jgi:hypothetical protein
MRLYSTAYLAYGLQIPDTDTEAVEAALQALDNGVHYLTAGRFDEQRTYLTTECHNAEAGQYLGLAPETLNERPERAGWDQALIVAAAALGHTDTPAPGWLLTADVDN